MEAQSNGDIPAQHTKETHLSHPDTEQIIEVDLRNHKGYVSGMIPDFVVGQGVLAFWEARKLIRYI